MTASQARDVLRQRADSVNTVSADAQVVLTRPDGQSVQLDAVLVMSGHGWMHLRAWKLGNAVLDLTIKPDGVWLMLPPGEATANATTAPTTGPLDRPGVGRQIAGMWDLLFADQFWREPEDSDVVIEDATSFDFRRASKDGLFECVVDKRTLTPSVYRLFDSNGVPQFSLELDKYASINGISWPMKIVARQAGLGGDSLSAGTIEVDLGTVELNTDLPDGAFVPPGRARKLP